MEFQTAFAQKIELIDKKLDEYLRVDADVPDTILEAMRYSVFAGGKRIRPVLLLSSYALFQDDLQPALPFACALEMIHTYSLIHDDLPAMDDSDLRRGRKTNHIVYGEAMAVLAGDALLNFAFETMLAPVSGQDDPAKRLRAAAYMAKCSGISGMIGGQVLDIQSENKTILPNQLMTLHDKKTGGLIKAAACCGAVLGGATDTQVSALEAYAYHLGLAFQIKDDILDVEGDAAVLGKPTGGDGEANKNTYVTLYGIKQAKQLLAEHTGKAMESLSQLEHTAFLLDFTDYLLHRDK